MSIFRSFFDDLYQSGKAWSDDSITLHSSSLAYYTVFSIAPLLVIAIAVAGFILGEQSSQEKIFGEVQGLMGVGGAEAIQNMVQSASAHPNSGIIATVLSIATLIIGATGVFQQLQTSLNMIWKVQAPTGEGIVNWLRRRIFTLAMVGVISFLLLISLIATTLITAATKFLGTSQVWQFLSLIVSIIVITILFASVYKFLPDVKLSWRRLFTGSLLTSILFSLGKWLIGLYIAHSSVSSSYGAAGSLVVLLIWVYYSAMIFYFGAEFIKVSVIRKSQNIELKKGAQFLDHLGLGHKYSKAS